MMRRQELIKDGSRFICPKSYTWLVQKQLTCFGGTEYMIEIKELDGCVSYGESFAEAKKGLQESIQLWFKYHRKLETQPIKNQTHLVHMEPKMTKEEFEQINKLLLHILLN
ncbi:type II toxin-antitoxin system HicB family antitoxin [Anaerobacillus isosaccharinicus]|uniref:Type II toxin-antitoxin system HicB family antitoxin n=2 Tax=Anaerobacillus isosaccharinicus TaxID=1532552 RepID=A0A7S7R9F2_9BACI|nr:type II toxin-antitoxin system HicB family antitoxin [Anaerobacillus isosaccharinicus]MBA5588045.1 type II toxin-antitoxin system HicB family antitoxin [Anaerobacillus isosaccharinicus]QOY33815.1 type II toxin-antitoxin system HicB family antitoxin [Anaerobacillus isosaccharinicus]